MRAGEVDAVAIGAFLLAQQVALQFHVDVSRAEDAADLILVAEVTEQRDQPRGMFFDVLPASPALALRRSQVYARE